MMRRKRHTLAAWASIGGAVLVLSGCATERRGQRTETWTTNAGELAGQSATLVKFQPGAPGGVAVQTYEKTARVSAIDRPGRQVTLVTPDGVKTVVKAGPETANFEQIQVGDQVKGVVTEELAVFVRPGGEPEQEPAAAEPTTLVGQAPQGAKPGIIVARTVEVAGTLTALDVRAHQATLKFADGQARTFRVRRDVDLTQQRVGDEVIIRSTQVLALLVEKP